MTILTLAVEDGTDTDVDVCGNSWCRDHDAGTCSSGETVTAGILAPGPGWYRDPDDWTPEYAWFERRAAITVLEEEDPRLRLKFHILKSIDQDTGTIRQTAPVVDLYQEGDEYNELSLSADGAVTLARQLGEVFGFDVVTRE